MGNSGRRRPGSPPRPWPASDGTASPRSTYLHRDLFQALEGVLPHPRRAGDYELYIRLLRQERLQRIGRTLAGARRHDDALSMDRNAGHLAELEAIAQQSAPRSASALAAPVRAVRRLSPYLSFLGLCIISVAWVEDPQKGALIFLQLTAGRREPWPALLKADSDATYQRRRAQVARAPPQTPRTLAASPTGYGTSFTERRN